MQFAFRICSVCVVLSLALLSSSHPGDAQNKADAPVRLAIGTSNYSGLPLFVAIDQHLFEQEHVEVDVSKFIGSATLQLPRLVRGDLDMIQTSPGPGLFNQQLEGVDLKFVASVVQSHNGWNDTTWFVVRQDLWDSKTIQRPRDLAGHTLDGAVIGSPPDYMSKTFVAQNGLTNSVKVTEKFRVPSDWYASFRNKAIDVQALTEPAATQLEQEGLAHKWLPIHAVLPGYQEVYFVVSASFLRDHRDQVKRVLRAYLLASRTVNASGGKWTPTLLTTAAKWTGLPEATLQQVPGPPYYGDYGSVDTKALQRVLEFYVDQALVPKTLPVTKMIDTSVLFEARRELGIR